MSNLPVFNQARIQVLTQNWQSISLSSVG